MLTLWKLLASVGGIGYVRGGGTVAALACCLALAPARLGLPALPWLPAALGTAALLALGTWAAQRVEPAWGKDSYRVVVDEVAGMWITLLGLPLTLPRLALGLLLFRFFDMAKPLGIRRLEALPGGVGVMADDVLAGVYAALLLHGAAWAGWV